MEQLLYLFPTELPPPALHCDDACDASDDGMLNLVDVIALLASLFGSETIPLPEPTRDCGLDPTSDDELRCSQYTSC